MSRALWTSAAAAAATKGTAKGEWVATGISADSRDLQHGDLFIALKNQRDGHDFVADAMSAGAAAAMVSSYRQDRPALLVEDTMVGLERLAIAGRDRCKSLRVGITGSAGKTSVKEMIGRIFAMAGTAHWSKKSYNNQWGVPISLAAMPETTQRAVFEIGTNSPGEISLRSKLVAPHMAAITCIAAAHLERLGNIANVAAEKSSIFTALDKDGVAILPGDDHFCQYLEQQVKQFAPKARICRFGSGPDNQAQLIDMQAQNSESVFQIRLDHTIIKLKLAAKGQHWGLNSALALLVARAAGIDPAAAAEALEGFAPPQGRGSIETIQLAKGGEAILLNDSYNANPHSMRAALSGLGGSKGRRFAVLGSMRELGAESDRLHAELAEPICQAKLTGIFLAGTEMQALADALDCKNTEIVWTDNVELIANSIADLLMPGDVLLVKGSNASGMGKVAKAIRRAAQGELYVG